MKTPETVQTLMFQFCGDFWEQINEALEVWFKATQKAQMNNI